MARRVTGSVNGGALLATSPLSGALTQLETAERELVAQHADAATRLEQLAAQLATTREAIAVLRRFDGVSVRAPAGVASVRVCRGLLQSGKHGQPAAAARESAVLGLIDAGVCTTAGIRQAVSAPAGASPQQHRTSIQNALSRMKVKRQIVAAGEGWALTAKGRKTVAAAAKEAP